MPNGNDRGNTRQRRARKLFLLNRDGDGEKANCVECGTPVDYATMVVDRIVPAKFGGTYADNNIQIHCRLCSDKQGKVLSMTLFQSDTHKAIWVEHHCGRCHYGMDCPILEKALTSGRKPPQWERKPKAQLMQDTIKCNTETRKAPRLKVVQQFEDVPMFDIEPAEPKYVPIEGLPDNVRPIRSDGDHA